MKEEKETAWIYNKIYDGLRLAVRIYECRSRETSADRQIEYAERLIIWLKDGKQGEMPNYIPKGSPPLQPETEEKPTQGITVQMMHRAVMEGRYTPDETDILFMQSAGIDTWPFKSGGNIPMRSPSSSIKEPETDFHKNKENIKLLRKEKYRRLYLKLQHAHNALWKELQTLKEPTQNRQVEHLQSIKDLLERYADGDQERQEDLALSEIYDTLEVAIQEAIKFQEPVPTVEEKPDSVGDLRKDATIQWEVENNLYQIDKDAFITGFMSGSFHGYGLYRDQIKGTVNTDTPKADQQDRWISVKAGQLFRVDEEFYVIQRPQTPSQRDTLENGYSIFMLGKSLGEPETKQGINKD